jgi:L-lactate dehydrogenase complex protein LldE
MLAAPGQPEHRIYTVTSDSAHPTSPAAGPPAAGSPPAGSPKVGSPKVGLFVTCLVDLFRPSVGFASVALLEAAGCRVVVPPGQTCCGQPAYNAGAARAAAGLARNVIVAFEDCDYVVAPSGSCAAMIRLHYPGLFDDDPDMRARALALGGRCRELVSFLVDEMNFHLAGASIAPQPPGGPVTYHDGCSGLREMGVRDQPRRLLGEVAGLELRELAGPDICCGFGGAFCVKYPAISQAMVDDKIDDIEASGAETVLAGDLGCLMQIAGRLKRRGSTVQVRHIAEILAGMTDAPAIGEGKGS